MGIAAILLGALESATYRLELRVLGRLSVAAMLLLGVITLAQLHYNYRGLERILTSRLPTIEDNGFAQRMRDALLEVQSNPVLQPYAELFMSNWIEVSPEELENKLALNERTMKFVPINSSVYRSASLLALAGKQSEAQLQIERAIWSYPADFPAQGRALSILAQKDPEHFKALLEFAINKNQEYLHAVSSK
jgi:hypothetical protein